MKFPWTYENVYYFEWDSFKLLNSHAASFYTNTVYAKYLQFARLINKPSNKHLSMASVIFVLNTGYFACILKISSVLAGRVGGLYNF